MRLFTEKNRTASPPNFDIKRNSGTKSLLGKIKGMILLELRPEQSPREFLVSEKEDSCTRASINVFWLDRLKGIERETVTPRKETGSGQVIRVIQSFPCPV